MNFYLFICFWHFTACLLAKGGWVGEQSAYCLGTEENAEVSEWEWKSMEVWES